MDRPDDAQRTRDPQTTATAEHEHEHDEHQAPPSVDEHETHATTGGAVAAGAVTGGVIGLVTGPVGAAIGAVGGALVAAAAERMMHSDDDSERARAKTERASAEDQLASP